MVKQDSWKRTDEIEIDLVNLLRSLCGQWKRAVLCGLAAAVLFGAAGWLKGAAGQAAGSVEQETGASGEMVLTETEEQAVADAVRLADEIRGLEEYLDSSVLMQLDPYHKSRYVMLYSIGHAQRQEIAAITESYFNFLLNGGAADALIKNGSAAGILEESSAASDAEKENSSRDAGAGKSCLAELIGVYQKTYSFPYQVALDDPQGSSLMAETVFYVEITGRDAASAKRMGLDMQDVLEEYSASVKKNTGSHRLTLVSCEESVTADSGLVNQQREKRALLSSSRASLKTATDAFRAEQMAVYETASGEEKNGGQPEQEKHIQNGILAGKAVRYGLAGMLGSVLIYGFVFSCWYVFGSRVKSAEELKRMYVFPVFGAIDAGRQTEERVLNHVRLACQKKKITKLYAVSDFAFTNSEKECLERMAEHLKSWKIDMLAMENAIADTAAWDMLEETGNVLMLLRTGTSTYQMIDDAMYFYTQNDIQVAGTAVFLKSRLL